MKGKKLYFGWVIVAVSFLVMMLQFSPSIQIAGLYVVPIAEDFGISRTASSFTITIGTLVSMVASLFSGRFLTKHSIRLTMCVGLLIYAGCYLTISFTRSVVVLYTISVVRGLIGTVVTMLPTSIVLNNWFPRRMTGKVISISLVGVGTGSMIFSPITGHIIENLGWRSGYRFFAVLSIFLIPFVVLTYYRTPEEKGLSRPSEDDSTTLDDEDATGIAASYAVRSMGFWLVAVSIACCAGASQSWYTNGASHLNNIGFASVTVSTVFSLTAFGNMIGKLTLGALSDRFGARAGMSLGSGCVILGYITLVTAPTVVFHYAAGLLIGFGVAMVTLASPLITGDIYGRKDFGVIVGYFNIFASLGASLVPLLVSSVFDLTGSYTPAWYLMIAISVISILFVLSAYGLTKFDRVPK